MVENDIGKAKQTVHTRALHKSTHMHAPHQIRVEYAITRIRHVHHAYEDYEKDASMHNSCQCLHLSVKVMARAIAARSR